MWRRAVCLGQSPVSASQAMFTLTVSSSKRHHVSLSILNIYSVHEMKLYSVYTYLANEMLISKPFKIARDYRSRQSTSRVLLTSHIPVAGAGRTPATKQETMTWVIRHNGAGQLRYLNPHDKLNTLPGIRFFSSIFLFPPPIYKNSGLVSQTTRISLHQTSICRLLLAVES